MSRDVYGCKRQSLRHLGLWSAQHLSGWGPATMAAGWLQPSCPRSARRLDGWLAGWQWRSRSDLYDVGISRLWSCLSRVLPTQPNVSLLHVLVFQLFQLGSQQVMSKAANRVSMQWPKPFWPCRKTPEPLLFLLPFPSHPPIPSACIHVCLQATQGHNSNIPNEDEDDVKNTCVL